MSDQDLGPVPAGLDPQAYDRLRRRVLWSMPTGLFVIGSAGVRDGVRHHNLMTANLVVQVATAPKLVAIAVEHEAVTAQLIDAGDGFSVSILARADRALVRRFVKPVHDVVVNDTGDPVEMAGVAVAVGPSGAPVLAQALAWLDCGLRHRLDLGSHLLFIGEVLAASEQEATDDAAPEVLRMEDTRMNYGG
jgi:flavin reductase (DIM6/NTAB) family NADH-FMN oxidoreductase RutF